VPRRLDLSCANPRPTKISSALSIPFTAWPGGAACPRAESDLLSPIC